MKELYQFGKGLNKTKQDTELNTRRIQSNFPLVERKLDIISSDHTYAMDFPISKRDHSVLLTLKVKPDNCCECEPGAQTVVRDAYGYYSESIVPLGFQDGVEYPAKLIHDETDFWGNPRDLIQTGSNFNYGYSSPFFHPVYQPFPYIAGYDVNPDGGIIVPVDGMYSVYFQTVIGDGHIGGDDAEIVATIDRLTIEDGEVLDLEVSRKIYSVYKENLTPGGHINHMIILDNTGAWTIRVYASCIPLKAGDTVQGRIKITNVPYFNTDYGWGNNNNIFAINLLGLGFGYLMGYVFDRDTREPLQGATVSYPQGFGGSTITDEFGAYAFYELQPATYSVTAAYGGYNSMTRTAVVYFDEITSMDFNLLHV